MKKLVYAAAAAFSMVLVCNVFASVSSSQPTLNADLAAVNDTVVTPPDTLTTDTLTNDTLKEPASQTTTFNLALVQE